MTESQIAEHKEEWRRQEIDDKEFLEKQQFLSSVDCTQCIYRTERGECVCLTSVYFGEEIGEGDVCWEFEGDNDE